MARPRRQRRAPARQLRTEQTRPQCIVPAGGPLDGGWYWLRDWKARCDASVRIAQTMGSRPRMWAYKLTPEIRDHPFMDGVIGQVARYRDPSTRDPERTVTDEKDS